MSGMRMYLAIYGVALVVGCAADDARTPVDVNDLGITSIAVQRHSEGREHMFEVRGFDGDGDNIATLRWKVGSIGDLREWLPEAEEDDFGSEITISVVGTDIRMLTRETRELFLSMPEETSTAAFVRLPAVASALVAANITFEEERVGGGQSIDLPYPALSCSTNYLLTSPVAKQCCYGKTSPPGVADYTHHINPNNALIKRKRNLFGTGCKASDGKSSCTGSTCYYGPIAFGRPVVTVPPSGYPYWYIARAFDAAQDAYYCQPQSHSSNQGQYYADKVGTQATGQGCPGGGTGAGQWDY